jgi:hypothetical protein
VKQVTLDLVPRKINAFSLIGINTSFKFIRIYSEIIAVGYGEIKAPIPINIKVLLCLSAHDSG